ncbi:hypothetical protein AOLI_G00189660 [Acnodon oligacanthus]
MPADSAETRFIGERCAVRLRAAGGAEGLSVLSRRTAVEPQTVRLLQFVLSGQSPFPALSPDDSQQFSLFIIWKVLHSEEQERPSRQEMSYYCGSDAVKRGEKLCV